MYPKTLPILIIQAPTLNPSFQVSGDPDCGLVWSQSCVQFWGGDGIGGRISSHLGIERRGLV